MRPGTFMYSATVGLVVKWDLERGRVMKGEATSRVLELIRELQAEGEL